MAATLTFIHIKLTSYIVFNTSLMEKDHPTLNFKINFIIISILFPLLVCQVRQAVEETRDGESERLRYDQLQKVRPQDLREKNTAQIGYYVK